MVVVVVVLVVAYFLRFGDPLTDIVHITDSICLFIYLATVAVIAAEFSRQAEYFQH